jgi:hypothetical protein
VINGTTPTARHLNPHIDYTCVRRLSDSRREIASSLAFPMDMRVLERTAAALRRRLRLREGRHLRRRGARGGHDQRVDQDAGDVGRRPSGLALDEARSRST